MRVEHVDGRRQIQRDEFLVTLRARVSHALLRGVEADLQLVQRSVVAEDDASQFRERPRSWFDLDAVGEDRAGECWKRVDLRGDLDEQRV